MGSTKMKIDLDEETERDLRKLFNPFSLKGVVHKSLWDDIIRKYQLCDGINMKRCGVDILYSKCVKKGVKGLGFQAFSKAIATLGNKRFPEKKNPDPNDAIKRILQATVRKHDTEEMKLKKEELRRKMKVHKAMQQIIDNQKKIDDKNKAKQAIIERERKKKLKHERLSQRIEQLEMDKKERDERIRRLANRRKQIEKKEREKLEKKKGKKIWIEMQRERLERQNC